MRGSLLLKSGVVCVASGYSHCSIEVSADILNFPAPPVRQDAPISNEDLQRAQLDDVDVGPVFRAVTCGTRPDRGEWKGLSPRCKQLFRQWKQLSIVKGVLVRQTSHYLQIVLPAVLHHLVFVELHEKMGHLGLGVSSGHTWPPTLAPTPLS